MGIATSGSVIVAMLCATASLASGYLSMPERRETLASYQSCLARLEASAAGDRAQAKPRTVKDDGGFQEISLEDRSGGVKVTGRKAAQYEARIWYHNGRLQDDGAHYEISHFWNQTYHECRGKKLIMNDSQGYTLSTFEPMAPKAP